jgi:hypothetical protein
MIFMTCARLFECRRLNKVVAIFIGAELTAEYCPDRDLVNDAIGAARELIEQMIEVFDSANFEL